MCDVENVAINAEMIAIYAVLLLNLLFTLFCHEIFATIYVLSCGKKMTNIRSAFVSMLFTAVCAGIYGLFMVGHFMDCSFNEKSIFNRLLCTT